MVNKYNLCDKVRTKIHYENDNRKGDEKEEYTQTPERE